MYILRCTAKLLNELNYALISDEVEDDPGTEVWFANLLRFERRKCVLFTCKDTLYSIFVPNLRKDDFLKLKEIFTEQLSIRLAADGIVPKRKLTNFADGRHITIAKTNSKSVLGSMNDLALQIKYHIKGRGGLACVDIDRINQSLNRVPMGPLGYRFAVERMKEKQE